MLKNKLRSLEKEMKNLVKSKQSGVFFVGIENGEYIVQSANDNEIFRGTEADYRRFIDEYEDNDSSVFIVDDIPREVNGTNIFDWIN